MIDELATRMDYVESVEILFPDAQYAEFLNIRNWPRTFKQYIEERKQELLAKKARIGQLQQECEQVGGRRLVGGGGCPCELPCWRQAARAQLAEPARPSLLLPSPQPHDRSCKPRAPSARRRCRGRRRRRRPTRASSLRRCRQR